MEVLHLVVDALMKHIIEGKASYRHMTRNIFQTKSLI